MVLELETEQEEIEIIRSDNWELPIFNLGQGKYEWRPYRACLPYPLFQGPVISRSSRGFSLEKDLIIDIGGPRGAAKTQTNAYFCAKKMRLGQKVWGNFPVSFYVVEPGCWDICEKIGGSNETLERDMRICSKCKVGIKTYYENEPLNFDKLYEFNSEISEGTCSLTEMQYYIESRTSGRLQNRFLGYQLMQIRKNALSFIYDVQNQRWIDNRFRWSDDLLILCSDVSKMNYQGPDLEEGEVAQWMIRDISGASTGRTYEDSKIEHGPFYFVAWPFWWIYPTKWKVDVYDAVYSMKQRSGDADAKAQFGAAMSKAIEYYIDLNQAHVSAKELRGLAANYLGREINNHELGYFVESFGIKKFSGKNNAMWYDLTDIINDVKELDKESK